MTNQEIEKIGEKRLLGDLVKNPNRVFDVVSVLKPSDFCFFGTSCIFKAIIKIAETDGELEKNDPIDKTILEQKISELFSERYQECRSLFGELLNDIYKLSELNFRDFKSSVNFVLKNSITKNANRILEKTKKEIGSITTHGEILATLEKNVFDFTSNAIYGSDIVILGEKYHELLALRERLAEQGNLHIGIDTGFPEYNKAIGGGLRDSTINLLAARSKMGKSWWGLKIADNVARQDIPVLYLDTELEDNYQADRRCAQISRVPIYQLEKALWRHNNNFKVKITNSMTHFTNYPIHYVDIKGWSIDRQISVIRKFFAKYVGKRADGRYNRALVVLDYLKLMRAREKGADKEWEALGYRMTILHDLMGQYNNPMLALAQQNRDGLEKEDESTISGSDRIIWLCDNFSVLSPISDAELLLHEEEAEEGNPSQIQIKIPNMRLKVVVCRHGPGTPKSYIAYYFDIKDRKLGYDQICGHIEEGTRRVSIAQSK